MIAACAGVISLPKGFLCVAVITEAAEERLFGVFRSEVRARVYGWLVGVPKLAVVRNVVNWFGMSSFSSCPSTIPWASFRFVSCLLTDDSPFVIQRGFRICTCRLLPGISYVCTGSIVVFERGSDLDC